MCVAAYLVLDIEYLAGFNLVKDPSNASLVELVHTLRKSFTIQLNGPG